MQSLSGLAFGVFLAVGTVVPSGAALSASLSVPAPGIERPAGIQNVRWVRRCNYSRCRNVWVGPYYVQPRVVVRPRIVRPSVVVRPGMVVRTAGSRHVRWCLDRYRSYDPASNTFVSYDGEVRRCVSPYR